MTAVSVVAGVGAVVTFVTAGAGAALATSATEKPSPTAQDTTPRLPAAPARDTLAQDTIPPDTVPADTTPIVPPLRYPDEWVIASWDRAELWLTTALTLGELLETVPWLRVVRFGFLEGPAALTAFGAGPAAIEYTIDGYRVLPHDAGAVDAILIALTDIESVEVRRVAGGYRVDVSTRRLSGPTPYSSIEGGTGDYAVTLLRGLFLARFLDGEVAFGLDRVETSGFGVLDRAERIATALSYAHRLPLGWGAQVRWRSSNVSRSGLEAPERSDFVAHLRRRFGDAWTVDLTAGRARSTIDSVAGGMRPSREIQTTTYGLQITTHISRASAALRFEAYDGAATPDYAASLEMGLRPVSWLALGGDARTTWWSGERYDEGAARLRWVPLEPISLGAELAAGSRRVAGIEAASVVDYRRMTWLADARVRGVELTGSAGRWRTTPSPPFGFFYDRDVAPDAGGTAWVWRAAGSVPTPIRNVRIRGLYERREEGDFLYWPLDRAEAGATLRGLYMGGQLEVNAGFRLTVRGPMRSTTVDTDPPSPVLLPRRIGSAGELVVRVKDVRIFLSFEGFTDPEESPDVGGAPFPQTRTVFGLKWEFWN